MQTQANRTVLALMALAMLALFLAPVANAQGGVPAPAIQFDGVPTPPANALKPEIDSGTLNVKFKYALPSQALQVAGVASAGVIVNVVPTCDNPNVVISGPQQVILPLAAANAANTVIPGSTSFQISITRQAPGLQLLNCKVVISANAVGAIPAAPASSSNFQVKADFYPLLSAKVATKVQEAGPQKQIPFAIELTNFGNAQTQITFSLSGEPDATWNPILPEVLILDSQNNGGAKTTDTATFTINTPFKNGWNNKETSFQVVMTPSATADASKVGNVVTASVLARVRGVYVPGFEPAIMLAAVLGTALVARLAKRDD